MWALSSPCPPYPLAQALAAIRPGSIPPTPKPRCRGTLGGGRLALARAAFKEAIAEKPAGRFMIRSRLVKAARRRGSNGLV
jgi:hypothetical protein